MISWDNIEMKPNGRLGDMLLDQDILVLYCPAGEIDRLRFCDVATLSQARATHDAHHDKTEQACLVYPLISPCEREVESCEFRLNAHCPFKCGRNRPKRSATLLIVGCNLQQIPSPPSDIES